MNDFGHSLSKNPGYSLHEWDHSLISVVMSRDNPHHPKSVHHGGQCVDHCLEGSAVCYVLKVSLQCGEKPHIILSLSVIFVEIGSSILDSIVNIGIHLQN